MTVFTPRQAARVLLLDAADRVLLFHGWDPARPGHRYWFTPGGGLDPGESSASGAARELAEETGLRVPPDQLGGPVWQETTEFTFGGRWFRQEQEFFLCRVPGGEFAFEVDTAGFDQIERDSIDAHRWWSVADLERTGERFYPTELPALLRRILGGEGGC